MVIDGSELPLSYSLYPDDIGSSEELTTLKTMGEKMLQSCQFKEAYDFYNQALPLVYQKATPSKLQTEEILLNLAQCSLSLQKYRECKNICHEILSLNERNETALKFLSIIYKQIGNPQKAEKYAELAKEIACESKNVESPRKLRPQLYRMFISLFGGALVGSSSRKWSHFLPLFMVGFTLTYGVQAVRNRFLKGCFMLSCFTFLIGYKAFVNHPCLNSCSNKVIS